MSTIGMAGLSKAYMVERVARTLQEKLAFSIENITNVKEYYKEITFLVDQYNNKWEHSTIMTTPNEYLNKAALNPPWGKNEFNYYKNKIQVDRKMREIEKKVPLMSPVRVYKPIKTQVNIFFIFFISCA